MKIYTNEPLSWKELQIKAAQLLDEAGYKSEVEKDIKTVRGVVNIDVYAERVNENPKSIILCECKFWKAAVPQSVIHAFRNVVADYGANEGFIISKNGFQKGAYLAAEKTNIKLFNWREFEDFFLIPWIKRIQFKTSKTNKDLIYYCSAAIMSFNKTELGNLNSQKMLDFQALNQKYFNVAFYSSYIFESINQRI